MKYFGTDGFRGAANEVLTVDHAFKIGRFLGWHLGAPARVAVGRDTRRSGQMFESALVAGLLASGTDCYLLGVIPTPGVCAVVENEGFDAAIMITASHNPFTDNGIKLINSRGHKMEAEVLELIEECLDGNGRVPLATGNSVGQVFDHTSGRAHYQEGLRSTAGFSLEGFKIGLDCANGAASPIARSLYESLGAEVFVIHDSPDGLNINVGCGSTHIQTLRRFVIDNGLDVGFAFDGDADRCIAVDEAGRVIDGDLILYVCGGYLARRGQLARNTVVTTVMGNLGFCKALERSGIRYEKTKVGDQNVAACMRENGFNLGGEQSGHVIFGDYESTGDGLMTSLRVMEAIIGEGRSLSALASEVATYPQRLTNVPVKNKETVMRSPELNHAILKVSAALEDEGRVLVRESGTEQLVRVMVEASTVAACDESVEAIVAVVQVVGEAG